MKKTIVFLLVTMVSGCATYSSNLQVGNDQSYASLKDQREALRTVQVYQILPEGAVILGKVDAGRCHRSFVETPPTQNQVIIDLKLAAYVKGADGIIDIKVTKESGLTKNCWYILDGEATMFMLPKK